MDINKLVSLPHLMLFISRLTRFSIGPLQIGQVYFLLLFNVFPHSAHTHKCPQGMMIVFLSSLKQTKHSLF